MTAAAFPFAISYADLPRVNALRLAMGSDFWPDAAFAVFASAMRAEAAGGALAVHLPQSAIARSGKASIARGYRFLFVATVRVQQEDPDPFVVAYLERLARRYGLKGARAAASALLSVWSADPCAWPGAPAIEGVAHACA